MKSTPAALPNATGVVIDFDPKICCYLSTMKSIACATSEFLFCFFFGGSGILLAGTSVVYAYL